MFICVNLWLNFLYFATLRVCTWQKILNEYQNKLEKINRTPFLHTGNFTFKNEAFGNVSFRETDPNVR